MAAYAKRVEDPAVRCGDSPGITIVAFGAPDTGNGDADMEPGWWQD